MLWAGCGDDGGGAPKLPLTATEAAPLMAEDVRSLAQAWRTGGAWLEDAPFAAEMLGDLAGTFDDDDTSPEPEDGEPSVADQLDAFADALEQELLTADHLASEDGTTVIYAVPGAELCGEDADPDCATVLGSEPVELHIVRYAEGELTVSVRVGTPPVELASLTLSSTRLSAKVSLTALAPFVRRDANDDTDDFTLDQLSGRVSASIEATSDGRLALAYGSDPVTVRGTEDGDTAIDIRIGRTSTTVLLDGAARTVDVAMNVGEISLDATISDPEYGNHSQALDFPGVTAAMHLDEGATTMDVTDLSLGSRATTMRLDGQTVMSIDLNRSAGRSVDLSLRRADDALEVAVSPSLTLAAHLSLGAIAGSDAGWAANETMTITLDGAPSPTVRSHDDGLVEIVAGTMRYTSSARPDLNMTASAGQCVLELADQGEDETDDDVHPFESVMITDCE